MYTPLYRLPSRRLANWRWYQLLRAVLHLVASLGLVASLIAVGWAETYSNRGIATGSDFTPMPWADLNPLAINTALHEEVDPAAVERSLDMISAAGFGTVRQVFAWDEIEPQPGSFVDEAGASTWLKYDRIVDLADARGLQIIARLERPPSWARPAGARLGISGPPDHGSDYAGFVEAVVGRYRGRVTFFQLWDKPNLASRWGGQPASPREYVELLAAGYRAVKRANPDAVVLLAGLAPDDGSAVERIDDLRFLQQIYDLGAARYFDIAAVVLYGFGHSPYDRQVGDTHANFSRAIRYHEVMLRNGDVDTPIWATEYGWVSLPSDWSGRPSLWGKPVSATTQGAYLVDGYLRAAREWPWMGVMAVSDFRRNRDTDDPARGFALVDAGFSPRPAWNALSDAAPMLQLDFTGAYRLASRRQASLDRGESLDLHFCGERLDLLVTGSGRLDVSVDGVARPQLTVDSAADDAPRLVTIADDLPDRPHDLRVRVRSLAGGEPPLVSGYVVSRRPMRTWIYPWIVSSLMLALVLVLFSCLWAIRDVRRLRTRAAASERAIALRPERVSAPGG